MVGMIQRIFHSFEHNNHGALYPPPEGTGFTARVITEAKRQGRALSFCPLLDGVTRVANLNGKTLLGGAVPRDRLHRLLAFSNAEKTVDSIVAVLRRFFLRIIVPLDSRDFFRLHHSFLVPVSASFFLPQNRGTGLLWNATIARPAYGNRISDTKAIAEK